LADKLKRTGPHVQSKKSNPLEFSAAPHLLPHVQSKKSNALYFSPSAYTDLAHVARPTKDRLMSVVDPRVWTRGSRSRMICTGACGDAKMDSPSSGCTVDVAARTTSQPWWHRFITARNKLSGTVLLCIPLQELYQLVHMVSIFMGPARPKPRSLYDADHVRMQNDLVGSRAVIMLLPCCEPIRCAC
jgi:hypothetical protein